MTVPVDYPVSVFINCPFDKTYRESFFNAIVFTILDCGFIVRCSLETIDAVETRLSKILRIISECRLGVHDISNTELDPDNQLPRFNMPLELGMFLAMSFLSPDDSRKACLVLDREQYRYQKFCSDIAGQDIKEHHGDVESAVHHVRDFLRGQDRARKPPSGPKIWERYQRFLAELPLLCQSFDLDPAKLTYHDYYVTVTEWLKPVGGTSANP